MTDEIDRRGFLKRAAFTSAVSLSMYGMSASKVLGANDRVRLGVIGTGRQGIDDMQNFMRQGVEVGALCDVYQPNLDKALRAVTAIAPASQPKTVKDFRQVLDDKEIDAVLVATPDHWHALPAVMACQAGKDVYVEKPICVAINEGIRMVEVARKNKRVVQVGLWQRSNAHFQKAVELVQGGLLGWLMRTLGERRVVLAGLASATLAYVAYGLTTVGWMMYAVIVANVLAFAVGPALSAIVSKATDPSEQGLAMGSLTSLSALMAVAAPFIGTPLLAVVSHLPAGDWRIGAPFFMSAILSLVALVLAVAHFRRHRDATVAHVAPVTHS